MYSPTPLSPALVLVFITSVLAFFAIVLVQSLHAETFSSFVHAVAKTTLPYGPRLANEVAFCGTDIILSGLINSRERKFSGHRVCFG